MKYKKDEELGKRIREVLLKNGVETPRARVSTVKTDEVRKESIAESFRDIMEELKLDLSNDSLRDTPNRVAKMFMDELFWGLDYANFPKITTTENQFEYSDMLVEINIPVKSMCEHHFVPIKGVAHIAYVPKSKVVGLSKLNRVVHFFSRRPQVQERLSKQILITLQSVLQTEDVAVCIEAEHLCVSHRGVEDHGTLTTTTGLGGVFFEGSVRKEFFDTIRMSKGTLGR